MSFSSPPKGALQKLKKIDLKPPKISSFNNSNCDDDEQVIYPIESVLESIDEKWKDSIQSTESDAMDKEEYLALRKAIISTIEQQKIEDFNLCIPQELLDMLTSQQ